MLWSREREAGCRVEEGKNPARPSCQFDHRGQRGSGCPIRYQSGNAIQCLASHDRPHLRVKHHPVLDHQLAGAARKRGNDLVSHVSHQDRHA
jgi:hypothetical protein